LALFYSPQSVIDAKSTTQDKSGTGIDSATGFQASRRAQRRMPMDWGLARDVQPEETLVTEAEWLAATEPRPIGYYLP
jgi:hypothetical protein